MNYYLLVKKNSNEIWGVFADQAEPSTSELDKRGIEIVESTRNKIFSLVGPEEVQEVFRSFFGIKIE